MKTHISQVISSSYCQLRRIRQVLQLVRQDVAQPTDGHYLTAATNCFLSAVVNRSASAACNDCSSSCDDELVGM